MAWPSVAHVVVWFCRLSCLRLLVATNALRPQPKVVTIFQKMGQSKEVYDALKFLQVPACQRCVREYPCVLFPCRQGAIVPVRVATIHDSEGCGSALQ